MHSAYTHELMIQAIICDSSLGLYSPSMAIYSLSAALPCLELGPSCFPASKDRGVGAADLRGFLTPGWEPTMQANTAILAGGVIPGN